MILFFCLDVSLFLFPLESVSLAVYNLTHTEVKVFSLVEFDGLKSCI